MKKLSINSYSNKITPAKLAKRNKANVNLTEVVIKVLHNKGYRFNTNEIYQNGYDIVTFDIHVTEPLDFIVKLNYGNIIRNLGTVSYYKMITKLKVYLGLDYKEFPKYPNPDNTVIKLINLYNIDIALFDKDDMITLRPRELFF